MGRASHRLSPHWRSVLRRLRAKSLGGSIGIGALLFLASAWVGGTKGTPVVGMAIGSALLILCWSVAYLGPGAYNREEYPPLLECWRRTFRCDRCGEFFEVDARHLQPGNASTPRSR